MVSSPAIRQTITHLPNHLTGIFVGGTSGLGEYALQAFSKHCAHPNAYFIGRSQSSADRILTSLKSTNPNGTYTFIQSDTSLIKNVDAVCERIIAKEKYVNLLFISQGTMISGIETEEGLHAVASLLIHSRTRFILNLLPLLQAAPNLRRVVSVFTGTKEGPIANPDLQMRNVGSSQLLKMRGQAASTVTMSLEEVAKRAPDVSFIHGFPGPVRSNIARGGGVLNAVMRGVFAVVGRFVYIPEEESGERHLFMATSAMFPAKEGGVDGVEVEGGSDGKGRVAVGTDGREGSGVYVVDENCEEGNKKVLEVLRTLRDEGKNEYVWKHIQEEFMRITGKESL